MSEFFTYIAVQLVFRLSSCTCQFTVARWVPLVEQELLALSEHTLWPRLFSWVRVAQFLVLCVVFCRSLSFCLFSVGHCIICLLRLTVFYYHFCIIKLFIRFYAIFIWVISLSTRPVLTLRQNKHVLWASRGKGAPQKYNHQLKSRLNEYIIHNENSQSQLCFQECNNQSQPCFQEGDISFTASFSVYKYWS